MTEKGTSRPVEPAAATEERALGEAAHAELVEALESPTNKQDAVGRGAFKLATASGLSLILSSELGPGAAVVGAIVGEAIEHFIPRLREQRLVAVLKAFSERLRDVEAEQIAARFRHEEFIALFEDAVLHAARATSQERIEQVAAILARGLTDEEARVLQHRHVLSLLAELNDIEVILLRAYARHPSRDEEYRKKHSRDHRGGGESESRGRCAC